MKQKQVNTFFYNEDKPAVQSLPVKLPNSLEDLVLQANQIRESYEQIIASSDAVEVMFDPLPLPYIKLNENGLMCNVNSLTCDLLKSSKSQLINKDFSVFISKNSCDQYFDLLQCLKLTTSSQICEVEIILDDKTQFAAQIHCKSIKLQGTVIYHLILVDVTEKKILQKKCARLQESLTDLKLTHNQRERINSVGGMVAEVTHELYQPLMIMNTYLAGCLNSLKNNNSDDKIISMLQKAQIKVEESVNMISGLKNFFLKGITNKSLVNINSLIIEVIESFDHEMRENNILLKLSLNLRVPDIALDKIQISQALINIIKNSIEALRSYSRASRNLIIETDLNSKKSLIITIQDNGPGISTEYINDIFSPLFSLKPGGCGLGLSITKSIIDAHYGKISVSSIREGAKFLITLPYEVDYAD